MNGVMLPESGVLPSGLRVSRGARRPLLVFALFLGLTACGDGGSTTPSPAPELLSPNEPSAQPADGLSARDFSAEDLPDPDLSSMDPAVARQLADARTTVLQSLEEGLPSEILGARLGDLAMLYHAYDLLAAAEPVYALAQGLDDGSEPWSYYRGLIAQRQGRHDDALAFFERLPPETAVAWRKGLSLRGLDRDDEAARFFEEAAKDPQNCPAALFELGRLALDEDRPEDAVARFEEVLRRQSSAEQVFFPLGRALRQLGRTEEAGRYLERSAEREKSVGGRARCEDPRDSRLGRLTTGAAAFITRGQHARFAGDLQTAVAQFEKAVEVAPQDPIAHQALAKGSAELGDLDRAVVHFRRASELDPSSPWLANDLATVLLRAGRLPEAETVLGTLLEAHPSFAPAHVQLAGIHRSRGQSELALANVAEALDLEPGDPAARGLRAQLLLDLGRKAEAIDEMGRLLDELPPENPAERMGLAVALAQLGDTDRAVRHLGTVAEDSRADPKTRARAHLNLAGLQIRGEDFLGARRSLERALDLDPELTPAKVALERLPPP